MASRFRAEFFGIKGGAAGKNQYHILENIVLKTTNITNMARLLIFFLSAAAFNLPSALAAGVTLFIVYSYFLSYFYTKMPLFRRWRLSLNQDQSIGLLRREVYWPVQQSLAKQWKQHHLGLHWEVQGGGLSVCSHAKWHWMLVWQPSAPWPSQTPYHTVQCWLPRRAIREVWRSCQQNWRVLRWAIWWEGFIYHWSKQS